jgi:hypothetical protein
MDSVNVRRKSCRPVRELSYAQLLNDFVRQQHAIANELMQISALLLELADLTGRVCQAQFALKYGSFPREIR